MKVSEVVNLLRCMPPDVDVTIDIDDGMDGNFREVLGVRCVDTIMSKFVVIDADFMRPPK